MPAYCPLTLQLGHTDFVSAVAYAPPGLLEGCPAGAVVSGSRDTTVMVWDLETAAPVQRLEGHQYQVGLACGLLAMESWRTAWHASCCCPA